MVQFANPILGGTELVREAIQSDNFNISPTGVTGWQIKRDGTATFTDVTVGSPNYQISSNGTATFNQVTANSSLIYQGTELSSYLGVYPKGILAIVTLSGQTAGYTGTLIKFGEIVIPNFDSTRQYSVGASNIHFNMGTSTSVRYVKFYAYLKFDATPTTADTLLFEQQYDVYTGSGFDQDIDFRHPWYDAAPTGTNAHIAFFFSSDDTSGQVQIIGKDISTQALGARIYTEDCGPIVTYSNFNMGTGTTPVQTYTKTYNTIGTHVFQGDGTNRDATASGYMYQGYYSSVNGNQFSIINMDYTTIAADLAGATITKTEVYLKNVHWYYNSGGTAIIGYGAFNAGSGSYTYSNVTADVTESSFSLGQGQWVTVNNSIGNAFKSGAAHSLAIGKGPSTSLQYYGYFAGYGQTGAPQLRITYQK